MLEKIKDKKLYIYGMGEYGIDICLRLRDVGIMVDSFIDGNSSKWNRQIYGIPCCPLSALVPTEEVAVIVGLRDSAMVEDMLCTAGYINVFTYQEIWQELKNGCVTEKRNECEIEEIRRCKKLLEDSNIAKYVEWSSSILQDIYEEICRQRCI